jgi:hypothetical protein
MRGLKTPGWLHACLPRHVQYADGSNVPAGMSACIRTVAGLAIVMSACLLEVCCFACVLAFVPLPLPGCFTECVQGVRAHPFLPVQAGREHPCVCPVELLIVDRGHMLWKIKYVCCGVFSAPLLLCL